MTGIDEMSDADYMALKDEVFECTHKEPVTHLFNTVVGKSRGGLRIHQEKSEKRTSSFKHKLFAYQFTLFNVEKQKEISCRAVDTSYQKAKQKAAIKLLNQLEDTTQMPKNLIGFPNYRGHDFFIPVFLPLFWNKFFVESLVRATEIASTNKSKFKLFYGIKGLFEEYRKASFDQNFSMVNNPGPSTQPGRKPDLKIDQFIIKILLLLRIEQKDYATPGGDDTTLYKDIMRKLYEEFKTSNPFEDVLNFNFKIEFECSTCNQIDKYIINQPYLILRRSYFGVFNSLNDAMDTEKSFLTLRNVNCNSCQGSDFTVKKKMISLPSILVFMIEEKVEDDLSNEIKIGLPDNLNVFGTAYEKYAYSVNLNTCKVGQSDIEKPLRHHSGQSGDKISGANVILHIKHGESWKEVNNDQVLQPLRDYPYGSEKMLIFYRNIQ
ncbi:uncharacterized protein LOC112539820 [Tetranychus urticae]|nr:uncharacterized protein LOC112539820 [Tetranychus urticae]